MAYTKLTTGERFVLTAKNPTNSKYAMRVRTDDSDDALYNPLRDIEITKRRIISSIENNENLFYTYEDEAKNYTQVIIEELEGVKALKSHKNEMTVQTLETLPLMM